MRDWLVAADDRTGAFEVAALLAAEVGPVVVTVGVAPVGPGVVDLASRDLEAADAAATAAAIDDEPSAWVAHKIDSTLRGNWAAELRARRLATGRRVVVVPAWPLMGRTCIGGIVRVHGEPIGGITDQLAEATILADTADLREWLAGDGEFATCDVPDSETMRALAEVLAPSDVMVAGPAGPLGAVFAAGHAARGAVPVIPPTMPIVAGATLVICGSANAISHQQVQLLRHACPDVEVIAAAPADGSLDPFAVMVVADAARRRIAELVPATLVIIGGETAAAVLGDEPRIVGGSVAPGMPWSLDADGGGPLVITKAGGFGSPEALVELMVGTHGR